MIKIYKNSLGQQKIKAVKDYAPLSWICLSQPQEKEIKKISKKLGLPHDALEDSLDEFELPRVKIQNENLIVILRTVVREGEKYKTTPLTIILNNKFTATITTRPLEIIEDFERQRVDFLTTQQSNFFIKVCLQIIKYYQKYITVINRNVQSKKADLNRIKKADIAKLVETEEILNNFTASLSPTINVIKKILTHNYINLYQSDKLLIDDLLIDGEQVLNLSITNLKTIKNIRDGYTTVMTINLNQIIEILTYITVFFTIPMIITSAYGMNIKLPLASHPAAFFYLLMITIMTMGLAAIVFILWRKKF